MDLSNECDLETEKGVKRLKKTLMDHTDMTKSKQSMHYRSVEVGFPIPFLKGDTVLVDTPGIGGSGEVTQKLKEYLPNALSFVFVINVGSAGGMQSDRLPEILKSLSHLKIEDEMPCFDPKDVLFVTNKWDTIPKPDSDSEEDNEEEITWETLKSNLKKKWPALNEKHIFKMSLTEVSVKKNNPSTEQFKEFQKILESNIEKTGNIRVSQHLRFLVETLKTVLKGLKARLELNKMTEEEQNALTNKQNEKIKTLTKECVKTREDLLDRIEESIEETAKSCYDYMSTDIGKERILNPPGKDPILKVPWHPTKYSEEIKIRCCDYVTNFLKSSHVTAKFFEIKKDIKQFYERVCLELADMKNNWTDAGTNEDVSNISGMEENEISSGAVVGVVIATSPIWIPLLGAGVALAVAFGGITIAVSPILVPVVSLLSREERKKKLVADEYENYKSAVRGIICDQLKSDVGQVLTKYIDKVTVELLLGRIEALKKMTRQLSESRSVILSNRGLLIKLARKATSMVENAEKIFHSMHWIYKKN